MSKRFWPEAHEYANYVHNHSPTKALTHSTPNETFYGQKPSVSTLCIFGSHCHVHVPPELRQKLNSHSVDGILYGFEQGSKAYRVWIPSKHKCVTLQVVITYEKMHSNNDDNPTPSPNTAPSKGVPKPTPNLDDAQTEGVRTESSNPTINAPPASASMSASEPAQPPP